MSIKPYITKIGWDIGGAHIKYCAESESNNIIWYDIIDFDFWSEHDALDEIITRVTDQFSNKNSQIKNYFTMSAEMCDCFESRKQGVRYIIDKIKKTKISSSVFTKDGFIDVKKSNLLNTDDIGSYNWFASALYLSNYYDNAIAIDLGSTTCDFILLKDGKILNQRLSDLSGIQNKELLYTGCSRTPLFSLMNNINYKNRAYSIIPENFSTMADVYIILEKLCHKDIYSKSADGLDYSVINSYKRVSRSFGFDYDKSKKKLLNYLCNKLHERQIHNINSNLLYLVDKYFSGLKFKVIGLGLGVNIISEMCIANGYKFKNINHILRTSINGGESLSHLFPAFVLNRISDEI